jgi:cell division protease FtsH
MGCYERAKKLLQENFDTLNRIADGLIEYETLEADDVETLVKGGTITRDRPKPRVSAPPKLEKKDKRKILDALEPLPALEPNKA